MIGLDHHVVDSNKVKNEQIAFLEMMGSKALISSTTENSKKDHQQKLLTNGITSAPRTINDKRRAKHEKVSSTTTSNSSQHSGSILRRIKTDTSTSSDFSDKDKFYLTHLFISFVFILILLNRTVVFSFCPYDKSTESFVIYYPADSSTTITSSFLSIPSINDNNNHTSTQLIPYSKGGIHDMTFSQSICHSSYTTLDYLALLFQPLVNFHTIMPNSSLYPITQQATISAPSSDIYTNNNDGITRSNNDMQNPSSFSGIVQLKIYKFKRSLHKLYSSIIRTITNPITALFKRKDDELSNNNNTNKNSSQKDEEWSVYLSTPLEFSLSSKEKDILEKTAKNLLERLEKEYQEHLKDEKKKGKGFKTASDRLQSMYWGSNKSYRWCPLGTKDKNGETGGTRLLASYLKIMKWPENLITTFPFSHLCKEGCPTDFALAHTLEFREKYKPWAITPAAIKENSKGWFYVRGYSPTKYHEDNEKGGSSLLWYKPGIYTVTEETFEASARIMINSLDTCIADALHRSNGKVSKCNVVLDGEGFGISAIPSMKLTKRLLSMFQDHFPNSLGVFAITNVSRAGHIFINLVMPFLPIEVKRKFVLLPSDPKERLEKLKLIVDEKFLPVSYGGKDTFVFDPNVYYKTGIYKAEMISDKEGIEYLETMPYHA